MHPPAQPRLKPSVLGYEIVASLNADLALLLHHAAPGARAKRTPGTG